MTLEEEWRGSGKVLVIDDEEVVRSVTKQALSRRGFQVLTAENGEEGLERFHKDESDIVLVLLDMTMPGMNGIEVLEKLRMVNEHVPVLLSSGYTENYSKTTNREAQNTAFLQKPYQKQQKVQVLHCFFSLMKKKMPLFWESHLMIPTVSG